MDVSFFHPIFSPLFSVALFLIRRLSTTFFATLLLWITAGKATILQSTPCFSLTDLANISPSYFHSINIETSYAFHIHRCRCMILRSTFALLRLRANDRQRAESPEEAPSRETRVWIGLAAGPSTGHSLTRLVRETIVRIVSCPPSHHSVSSGHGEQQRPHWL